MNLSNIQIPKIKLSTRMIAILLALAGLFLFWFVSTKKVPVLQAEVEKYETENTTLAQTESNLANLYNNMSFYLAETKSLNNETEAILDEFPTFMYLEDKVLYVDNLLKNDLSGYDISEITYGTSTLVTEVSYGNEQTLELYQVGLTAKFNNLSYVEVKELLDYGLGEVTQRFVINSINMAYNEKTGYLSGDFSFNTYFIPGQATPYEFPEEVLNALGSSTRVNDLFGTR